MKSLLRFTFIAFFASFSSAVFAQEIETDLLFDAKKSEQFQKEREFPARANRGGETILNLPFFDDFSRYSLPTEDPNIPLEWQMWTDSYARINGTLAASPLTLGVATLDGLDETGYPYDFTDQYEQGPADTLTSLPIDLSLFDGSDNVYLVFYYERGGLGNSPDEDDSLYVDFYSPFGAGQWFQKWSIDGGDIEQTFTQVAIPINEAEFLLEGFKFRFRNDATISGNYDHWHIDYVLVDQNINLDNFQFDEVSMQYPMNTLINVYTSMPWTHYLTNPEAFMKDDITYQYRNLGETENITSGWKFTYEDQVWDFQDQVFDISGNANLEVTKTASLNGYFFDPSVTDTCATFGVQAFHKPTDAHLMNDSTYFEQVFANYYAYDDGSAERAYAVQSAGANIGVKYQLAIEDTLYGLLINWTPYGNDNSLDPFLLRVWADNAGSPGSQIVENFNSYTPEYYQDGYDVFTYYAYDNPLPVSGTIYVGWVQSNNVLYNVGNDKNIDNNTGRLFFQLPNGNWQLSQVTGSVMVRPVFRSGKTGPVGIEELSKNAIQMFPNPAEEQITLAGLPLSEKVSIEIYDISGRLVKTERLFGNEVVQYSLSGLVSGTYFIDVKTETSVLLRDKLIVR